MTFSIRTFLTNSSRQFAQVFRPFCRKVECRARDPVKWPAREGGRPWDSNSRQYLEDWSVSWPWSSKVEAILPDTESTVAYIPTPPLAGFLLCTDRRMLECRYENRGGGHRAGLRPAQPGHGGRTGGYFGAGRVLPRYQPAGGVHARRHDRRRR